MIQVDSVVRWVSQRSMEVRTGVVVGIVAPQNKNAHLFRNCHPFGWVRIEHADGSFSMKHPNELVVVG